MLSSAKHEIPINLQVCHTQVAFCLKSLLNAMSACFSVLDVFRIIPLVKAFHAVVFLTTCQLPRLKSQIEDSNKNIWPV